MMEIHLDGVSKRYGDTQVVSDLSLRLPSGRVTALLGPSGCGKTTTLRMVAGLERISGGRITIGDVVVDDGASVFVPPERRSLGMVFQSYALWPHKSVVDNVAYPLAVHGIDKAARAHKAHAALERVQLAHLAARMPDQLSGGQQQRVAVARAIIGDGDKAPPVLLLDEPLANLDAKLREEMRAELSLLARHSGATTVAVTHDQQEAFALADSVIVLDRGRLAQQGTPRELYDSPHTPFVGAFVGPMAFVPGTLTADALIVGDVRVSLNDVFVAPGVSANEVKVGLRPEWLDVTSDGGLPAVVEQALYLGREHELRTTLLSQPALLRWSTATSPAPKVGDVVRVRPVRAVAFAA